MNRYGKYYTTKKVAVQAMELGSLPQDSLQMISFYTFNLMNERQLVVLRQPASMFDSQINLPFDMDKYVQPGPAAHRHPRPAVGAELSPRGGRRAQQIIVITDGEPTAHIEPRGRADILPPRKTATRLAEVRKCSTPGVQIVELRPD